MAKGYTLVGMAMVLLLVGMSLGAAEPALRGYSGLLLAPTADALNRNQYSVSLISSEIRDFEGKHLRANDTELINNIALEVRKFLK